MKHSAHLQLRHVLFTQWMEISLNISHPEGSGLLHVLLIHMSVSLLSMGKSKTQQLLLNCYFPVWCCPDALPLWPLRSVNTQRAQHRSTFTHFLCPSMSSYLFSMNIPCVKHIWQGQIDCFLTKSNVMVISENVPVYWMSVLTRTCPSSSDPWRLLENTKVRKVYGFQLLVVFNSSIGCLRWYGSIIKLAHGEFCEH